MLAEPRNMVKNAEEDRLLTEKRQALKEKLKAKFPDQEPSDHTQAGSGSSSKADGYRLITDFIASIIVGVGLGLIFDEFAGTSPLGLIVFLLLGFASGMMKLIKASQKQSSSSSQDIHEKNDKN